VPTDIDVARGAGMHAVHFDPLGFCQDSDHPHIGSLLELLPLVKAIDAT
jgi:FMN phosphatase YigB (HAD superfamily)